MHLTKMQGLGNDYVYFDTVRNPGETAGYTEEDYKKLAIKLSNRHFALGSDGLIIIHPSDKADFRMQMFNADGSEAEMCGNGIRCVAKYVYDKGLTDKKEISVETLAGIQYLKLEVDCGKVNTVRVDMGEPSLDAGVIPVLTDGGDFVEQEIKVLDRIFKGTAVSMGNPHLVVFVEKVWEQDIEKYGSVLENMRSLFPNRTNVSFAEILDRGTIDMREWERGSGITLACGTGCCATGVAAIRTGRTDRKVVVKQPGGELIIEWDEASGHVFMTGPAVTVYETEMDVEGYLH